MQAPIYGNSPTMDLQTYQLIVSLKEVLHNAQQASTESLSSASKRLCEHLLSSYTLPEPARDERIALAPWQERKAKALMTQDLSVRLSITEVAAQCSLSRSHFSRAFKRATGLSPQAWALKARVQSAKTLLSEQSMAISQVGLECGFSDQSHFCRTFSKMVGVSPRQWRSLHDRRTDPSRTQEPGRHYSRALAAATSIPLGIAP